MTGGGSSIPEVQRLLSVLAAGRRVAEAGTAFGEGAAAMAQTATSVVTVELDPERAVAAARRLEPFSNVELLVGDWRELLPPRGPFQLVFLDGGGFKQDPEEGNDRVLGLLEDGGLLVMDDLTPGRPGAGSPARVGVRPCRARGGRDPDDAGDRRARARAGLAPAVAAGAA